jgi:hypothetical protein
MFMGKDTAKYDIHAKIEYFNTKCLAIFKSQLQISTKKGKREKYRRCEQIQTRRRGIYTNNIILKIKQLK